jgi:hypothetical protein
MTICETTYKYAWLLSNTGMRSASARQHTTEDVVGILIGSEVVLGFEVVELSEVDGKRSGARIYALQNAVCAGHPRPTSYKWFTNIASQPPQLADCVKQLRDMENTVSLQFARKHSHVPQQSPKTVPVLLVTIMNSVAML